jgi:hypothetical protein
MRRFEHWRIGSALSRYALSYLPGGSLTVSVHGYSEVESGLKKAVRLSPTADRIELTWLSGLKESFGNLPVNHRLVLRETKGIPGSRRFR